MISNSFDHNSHIVRSLLVEIFALFWKSLSLVPLLWFVFSIGRRSSELSLLELSFALWWINLGKEEVYLVNAWTR